MFSAENQVVQTTESWRKAHTFTRKAAKEFIKLFADCGYGFVKEEADLIELKDLQLQFMNRTASQ